jgi:protein-S-isoprenylcysteine O-methyltransferase Ste14
MTPPVVITFLTLYFLGPIPAWHFLLHAFLPAWRKSPRAYYLLAAAVWALFVPLAWLLAKTSPLLFLASRGVRMLGLGVSGAALGLAVWSMATLTPRRFFMWAVLRPRESPPERILRGPYRFTAHPTYLAILAASASNFLASGSAALLGVTAALSVLLPVVAVLEQRELSERLETPLPGRLLAPPSLSSSRRD